MSPPRPSRDKEKIRKWALEDGREVLWKDDNGLWHAAVNRDSTPRWAAETEDVNKPI